MQNFLAIIGIAEYLVHWFLPFHIWESTEKLSDFLGLALTPLQFGQYLEPEGLRAILGVSKWFDYAATLGEHLPWIIPN